MVVVDEIFGKRLRRGRSQDQIYLKESIFCIFASRLWQFRWRFLQNLLMTQGSSFHFSISFHHWADWNHQFEWVKWNKLLVPFTPRQCWFWGWPLNASSGIYLSVEIMYKWWRWTKDEACLRWALSSYPFQSTNYRADTGVAPNFSFERQIVITFAYLIDDLFAHVAATKIIREARAANLEMKLTETAHIHLANCRFNLRWSIGALQRR